MALTLPQSLPPASLAHLDAVDDLLVEYLEAVELYQLAQERLAGELKSGLFELSRAKVALGPLRLSQRGYDLSHTQSRVAVSIEEDGLWSLGQSASCVAAEEALRRAKEAAALAATQEPKTAPENASSSNSTSTASTATLRNRSAPAPAPSATTAKASSATSATPRPSSRNPLHQFSAMPPPSLVASQAKFEQAANAAVLVVSRRAQLGRVEERLQEAKARLRESLPQGVGEAEGEGEWATKPKKKKK